MPAPVTFAFDRSEPVVPLEARPASAAVGMRLDGAKGAGSYLLYGERIEVVAKPASLTSLGSKSVQSVLLKPVKTAAGLEYCIAGLALGQNPGYEPLPPLTT